MKNLKVLFIVTCVVFVVAACSKKKNDPNPGNNNQNTWLNNDTVSHGPYYFKFTFGDTLHNFSSADTTYPSTSDVYTTVSQERHDYLIDWPNIGFQITWIGSQYTADSIKEATVLDLQGKTFRFNDRAAPVYVYLTYAQNKDSINWRPPTTVSNNNYIHFDTVKYLETDSTSYITTIYGKPIHLYLVTGTCTTAMIKNNDSTAAKNLTNGAFRMLLSHVEN